MEGLRIKLHFDCCFVVDCVGQGGGLALLWMSDIMVEILSYSFSYINAKVVGDSKGGLKTYGILWPF